ncbi:protein CutA homolog [Drosophila obscura]|uniref:protein CutA homolog n=1 Tax=Drosophila obscura TaxID=7282 RepID=UPI001BB1A8B3|nr:protein CutA homolog [Drosophila obscura]
MQYRGNVPSRWLFARNLLIVSAAAAVKSRKAFASPRPNKRMLCSPTRMTDQQTCDSSYIAGSSSVAFVTTPDKQSAKKLAHGIIDRKIAACVNIIPKIESIYMWEGKVTEDDEYLMMIKTRTERIDELSKFVRENHPHSVPEVISIPIENGNLTYLNWIAQTVPELKKNKD